MLDKYKVLRNAERFVVEKKFSQAIQEYEKLLEKDGKDASLLNTIGDLYTRVDNIPKALKHFHRVAEIYLKNGFALRAIATYKKIHSLKPSDVKVNESLARLFEKQGLRQDARRHMEFLVEHYREEGDDSAAVTWMKRVVDLDPGAWQMCLSLAGKLAEMDSPSEAAHYYLGAVEILRKSHRHEELMEVCAQALDNAEHESKLVEAYAEAADRLSRIEEAEEAMTERLEQTGSVLPYKLALALLAERRGDPEKAHGLYRELSDAGHLDKLIRRGLQRTSGDEAGEAGDHDAIDLDAGADEFAGQEGVEQGRASDSPDAFDLGGDEWSGEDSGLAVEESPFHPAGTIEEVDVAESEPQEEAPDDDSGSGLLLDFDQVEAEEGREEEPGGGLFAEEPEPAQAEAFELDAGPAAEEEKKAESAAPGESPPELDDELTGTDELAAAGVLAPEEEEDDAPAPTPILEPEPLKPEEEAPEEEELEDVVITSLEEALEETDFYLKLGFQDEATRLLRVLLRDYSQDERVLRRAKKIPGLAPAAAAEKAAAEGEEAVPEGFDDEIDAALDALFVEGEEEGALDEVLRYDVERSPESQEESPSVHYDLGLAYKEMGLIGDAVQEFKDAVDLISEPEQAPLKILCCSMLASSCLKLKEYDAAVRWAREGLQVEGMKDFEWKALRYDLARALQASGREEEAREAYQSILERDDAYRDVKERIEELNRS